MSRPGQNMPADNVKQSEPRCVPAKIARTLGKERAPEGEVFTAITYSSFCFPTVTDPPTVWLVVVYDPLTVTPLVAVVTEPEMDCLGVV